MNHDQLISLLAEKAATRQFISFVYTKENGEVSKRVVQIGFDIAVKFQKEGQPLNGTGSWMTGHRQENQKWLIVKNGVMFIQASEIKGESKKPKCFRLDYISNLK